MVAWRRDPEFWSATQAEPAFLEGYERVAFDIGRRRRSRTGNRLGGFGRYRRPKRKALALPRSTLDARTS
jgi:hypothetical protein